jgi:hypothetical protein
VSGENWMERLGVVRHRRWLAWGVNHGLMIRPHWVGVVVVDIWNWLSCHVGGHEWLPDFEAEDGGINYTPDHDFCPNCSARRPLP